MVLGVATPRRALVRSISASAGAGSTLFFPKKPSSPLGAAPRAAAALGRAPAPRAHRSRPRARDPNDAIPPDAPSPLDVARLELTLTSRDDELGAGSRDRRRAPGGARSRRGKGEGARGGHRRRASPAERLEATVADLDVRAKVLVEREVALRSLERATETRIVGTSDVGGEERSPPTPPAATSAAIPSPRDQHRPLDRSIL